MLILGSVPAQLSAMSHEKDSVQYGMGLIVNVPFSESDVTQVVQDVAQNGIIRGTREYNKDEYITGAAEANSTRAFPEWTEGGKVFYKVRANALDPRNFKDTNDVGTLAVRYVVQGQDEKHTVLRIDAVFVEDIRHMTHPSNGSVEGEEYKDIHDRLASGELMKEQTAEAEQEKREQVEKKQTPQLLAEVPKASPKPPAPAPQPQPTAVVSPANTVAAGDARPVASLGVAQPPVTQTLEERVKDLRRQVERLVKSPGAPLKSAPFHTASTLQSLATGSEVLIQITTPYWLGVETHDGKHGWIQRDELEQLP
jgi:hypothetical protein